MLKVTCKISIDCLNDEIPNEDQFLTIKSYQDPPGTDCIIILPDGTKMEVDGFDLMKAVAFCTSKGYEEVISSEPS